MFSHLDFHHSGAYSDHRYASSIGTLVNREDTSKLTIILSDLKHTLLTVCMKCVEFFMFDHVLPNNGDIIMLDMNFDTLEDGDPMQ